jgi:arginase family enzyme
VIQLDAHLDLDGSIGGPIDHANVMSAVCQLSAVKKVIQVAVRGYDDRRFERYLRSYTDKLVSVSPATISKQLDPDLPCYVTLDVDCLDTSICLGTHHMSPGGLTFI